MKKSPCLSCGACCAAYCVAFPEIEADDLPGGWVPVALTVSRPGADRAMKGTVGRGPRCDALEGRVGVRVTCRIYEHRPSPCRAFQIAWQEGRDNSLCNRARSIFGLIPFSPW